MIIKERVWNITVGTVRDLGHQAVQQMYSSKVSAEYAWKGIDISRPQTYLSPIPIGADDSDLTTVSVYWEEEDEQC